MAKGIQILDGDIVINTAGTCNWLNATDKCLRDFGKMLVTDVEFVGNETEYYRYNPLYGVETNNTALFQGLSKSAVRETTIMLVNNAISNYIALQETRDNLDLGEVITGIKFDVYYFADEPRTLATKIWIWNALSTSDGYDAGTFVQDVV
jgi:hypothetical protein